MKILNKENAFSSDGLTKNIAGKSLKGGLSTAVSQILMFTVNTASTVVLARLLSPKDYGIFGMAVVVVNFAKMFMEAGLSIVTVQSKEISHNQTSMLFWMNVLVGFVLCGLVFISAPLVAQFYKHSELTAVTASLSVTFIIGGISVQHMSLLRRHMMFSCLTTVNIWSTILSQVATIILALMNWSYWAIVGGTIVLTLSRTMGMFYYCRWVPGWIIKGTGVKNSVKVGMRVIVANFFVYLTSNLDKILIGKFIGAVELGLYSKAYRLFMMPINEIRQPLTNVSISALSALNEEHERFSKYFYRIVNLLSTMTFPLTLYCYIESEFLIKVMLGEQWMGTVAIFKILAIAGFIQPIAGTMGILLLSKGYTQKYMFHHIANMVVTLIGISIGVFYGINGVAAGYVIACYIIFIPQMLYCFHNTPVKVNSFLFELMFPLLYTTVAGILSVVIVEKLITIKDSITQHIVFIVLYCLLYASISYSRKEIRATISMVIHHIPIFKKKS